MMAAWHDFVVRVTREECLLAAPRVHAILHVIQLDVSERSVSEYSHHVLVGSALLGQYGVNLTRSNLPEVRRKVGLVFRP